MDNSLRVFEHIVRKCYIFTRHRQELVKELHPFDTRNIHPGFPPEVRQLFDNGHFAQATFEAFKFMDKQVQYYAKSTESGVKLMLQAFSEDNPGIQLTPLVTVTDKDEQKGYQFLFAGSVLAIRNPRGHEVGVRDDPDTCLDHLSLGSMLLRRMEAARFKIPAT